MGHFILVALVVCACALVESNNNNNSPQDFVVPPYHQSAQDFREASKKVLELAPPPGELFPEKLDVDDKRRHYGLLVATVDELAEALLKKPCPTYDEYYDTAVSIGTAKGWSHPLEVGAKLNYEQQTLEDDLRDVMDLVQVECENPLIDCDLKVTAAVKLFPEKYERKAKLLLTVGELSKVYLSNTYADQAETYEVFKLLANGRKDLKELVEKTVDVLYQQRYGGTNQKAVDCKTA